MVKRLGIAEAKDLIANIKWLELEVYNEYSRKGAWDAYLNCISRGLEGDELLNEFMELYNTYADFKNNTPLDYLAIVKKPLDLLSVTEMRKEWSLRRLSSTKPDDYIGGIIDKRARVIIEKTNKDIVKLSKAEILSYLNQDYYVYLVSYKDIRIEKEIETLEELLDYSLMTFKEATELWGLGESTLRSVVKSERLIENIDYRKSGSTWLITENAMRKLYRDRNGI
ncbi:helix-turn-helix domain-containing protein [Clostridium sp.]|uniref:helix-turn-helix domain-containing protein n=1 Tax=Clostridium sp. TaxID=1506 RepID=UPI002FC78DD5